MKAAYKKYSNDKDLIQFFAPVGTKKEFKVVCAENNITMREVLLNFTLSYIKKNQKNNLN